MNLCFYCTSGRNFKTFGFKVIEELEFRDYVVKVIEINTINGLISFRNMINKELILTDSFNVLYPNIEKEFYSLEFINKFLAKYPFAVEIYDYNRE